MQSVQAARRFVSGRLLATRQGTILLGAAAAALSAIILVAYVNQYRNSLNAGAAPQTVLIASSLIEKGTPGDVVARTERFQTARVATDDVKPGALTDPAALAGTQAVTDVFPGQQITVADFSSVAVGLGATLTGRERAIALPIDLSRAMGGAIQAGDRVDILASFGGGGSAPAMVKTVLQDVYVISPPFAGAGGGMGGGGGSSAITVRATNAEAEKLAFVVDNGKLWAVLRPRTDAPDAKTDGAHYGTVLGAGG